jgi:hypothetical protein
MCGTDYTYRIRAAHRSPECDDFLIHVNRAIISGDQDTFDCYLQPHGDYAAECFSDRFSA